MRYASLLAIFLVGCSGSTGAPLVDWKGVAGGPTDVAAGQAYVTGSGYTLALDSAKLHLGAVYLNQDNPLSGKGTSSCVLPGTYVGEIFGPLDLDLLSPQEIPFPTDGEGTALTALTAEVWLLEGDIDAPDSETHVLDVSGTASKNGTSWPFSATVTIGQNRMKPPPDVAMPGANPICAERIVTPIAPVGGALTLANGGTLTLRVDPRHMFDGVDFSLLSIDPTATPPYTIPDAPGGIGDQLFAGLRADSGVYAISFK